VVDFVGWHVPIPLWLYPFVLAVVGMGGSVMLNRLANQADWSSILLGKRLRVA
jgi:probable poly-beta-1,6-N-acetyl-D-glucosamine export protein